MNLNPHRSLVKKSKGRQTHAEFFDHYENADESYVHITKIRQVQSVRAIAAEAEYLNLRARVDHLQNKLKQLETQIMNELNQILRNKTQARQNLTILNHKVAAIQSWHELERRMNRDVSHHTHHLTDFRQTVRQSKDALVVAHGNNLHANRRLLKMDETLKTN